MKKPTKEDIKRINAQCTKDHLANNPKVRSQLKIDRDNILYCTSSEQTRLIGFVTASMVKSTRLEIELLELNISRWKATVDRINAIVSGGGSTHLIDKYQNEFDDNPLLFVTAKVKLKAAIQRAEIKIANRQAYICHERVATLCR